MPATHQVFATASRTTCEYESAPNMLTSVDVSSLRLRLLTGREELLLRAYKR